MLTERLLVRPPVEADRSRFVELFTDESFTVFSTGAHHSESADLRFDRMLELAERVPYAKQPIVERASGTIVGYTGVGSLVVDGLDRLEWGWRLTVDTRGRGLATEATEALLALADAHDDGEVVCVIAAENTASRRVAEKVGFVQHRRVTWDDGVATDLLIRSIGAGGAPLVAPTQQ